MIGARLSRRITKLKAPWTIPLIVWATLVVVAPNHANASNITFTATAGNSQNNASTANILLNVPSFDTNLGTLTGVFITRQYTSTWTQQLLSQNITFPALGFVLDVTSFDLYLPAGAGTRSFAGASTLSATCMTTLNALIQSGACTNSSSSSPVGIQINRNTPNFP